MSQVNKSVPFKVEHLKVEGATFSSYGYPVDVDVSITRFGRFVVTQSQTPVKVVLYWQLDLPIGDALLSHLPVVKHREAFSLELLEKLASSHCRESIKLVQRNTEQLSYKDHKLWREVEGRDIPLYVDTCKGLTSYTVGGTYFRHSGSDLDIVALEWEDVANGD